MAMFKAFATLQLKLLAMIFLMGSFFLTRPANQRNACERDFHNRALHTHHYLVLTVGIAAALLLLVHVDIAIAEAGSIAAARAAGIRARREVAAVAAVVERGGAIAVNSNRVPSRPLLLLAVALSFAASLLAVVTFEDGFWIWTGCRPDDAGYHAGSPTAALLMVTMAVLHGVSAWVVVCAN